MHSENSFDGVPDLACSYHCSADDVACGSCAHSSDDAFLKLRRKQLRFFGGEDTLQSSQLAPHSVEVQQVWEPPRAALTLASSMVEHIRIACALAVPHLHLAQVHARDDERVDRRVSHILAEPEAQLLESRTVVCDLVD